MVCVEDASLSINPCHLNYEITPPPLSFQHVDNTSGGSNPGEEGLEQLHPPFKESRFRNKKNNSCNSKGEIHEVKSGELAI